MNKSFKPRTFTIKQRVGSLIGGLFILLPLAIFGVVSGVQSLEEYLSFSPSIIYFSGNILVLFSPVIFIPLLLMMIPPIATGKETISKFSVLLLKLMITGCVVAIICMFVFRFFYLKQLEQNGYIPCQGIPTGYMPGMGKQYVKDLSLCH